MNSFNAMARAIDYEIERQEKLYKEGRGDEIVQGNENVGRPKSANGDYAQKRGLGGLPILPEPDLNPTRVLTKRASQTFERKCQSCWRNS